MDWLKQIAELAVQRGLSQRKLASILGVSQQFLNDVVNQKREPSLKLKLAILGVTGYEGARDVLLEMLLTEEQRVIVLEWERTRNG